MGRPFGVRALTCFFFAWALYAAWLSVRCFGDAGVPWSVASLFLLNAAAAALFAGSFWRLRWWAHRAARFWLLASALLYARIFWGADTGLPIMPLAFLPFATLLFGFVGVIEYYVPRALGFPG